jgi:hypothetical protein
MSMMVGVGHPAERCLADGRKLQMGLRDHE